MINSNKHTVCEIFSSMELENRHFRPLYCDCRLPWRRNTEQHQYNLYSSYT